MCFSRSSKIRISEGKSKLACILPSESIFNEVKDTNKPRAKKRIHSIFLPRRSIFNEVKDTNKPKTKKAAYQSKRLSCGTTGNRTRDTRIFSPLLYQLSYGTIRDKRTAPYDRGTKVRINFEYANPETKFMQKPARSGARRTAATLPNEKSPRKGAPETEPAPRKRRRLVLRVFSVTEAGKSPSAPQPWPASL